MNVLRWWLFATSYMATLPSMAQESPNTVAAGRICGYYNVVSAAQTECANRFPSRRAHFDSGIQPWLFRNRPAMEKAVSNSVDHLKQLAITETERAQAMDVWSQTQAMLQERIKSEVLNKMSDNPVQFCEAMTALLSSGHGVLSVRFPQEFRILG